MINSKKKWLTIINWSLLIVIVAIGITIIQNVLLIIIPAQELKGSEIINPIPYIILNICSVIITIGTVVAFIAARILWHEKNIPNLYTKRIGAVILFIIMCFAWINFIGGQIMDMLID